MLHTFALFAAMLLPGFLIAAPVPSGGGFKDIGDLPVAANSMVVIQINGLERTQGRIVKMLESVDKDLAKQINAKLEEFLKTGVEGRDLKALDPKGRIFIATGPFTELGSFTGPFALILPVTDYKGFREKFLSKEESKSFKEGKDGVDEIEFEANGQAIYLVNDKKGYVVATGNKDLAEIYAGKYEKLTAKKLGSVGESFLEGDLSIFLNVERINEEYGAQIAQGKAFFPQLLQLAGGQIDKKQMEVLKFFIEGLFQVVEDAKGIVITVEARPEGANLRLDTAFTLGSATDLVLSSEKPSALKGLGALPAGQNSYSASSYGKAFRNIFAKIGSEFASEGDDKATEAIDAWTTISGENTGESLTFSGPDFGSFSVSTYADASKVTTAKLKVLKALSAGASYSNLVLKADPKLKEADQKVGEFTLHAASIEVDYEASVKGTMDETQREAAIEAMKKLVPQKQTIWFGSDGKRFVTLNGKDWDSAKKLLDAYLNGKAKLGDDAVFASARKQFPEEASSLSFIEAGGLLNTLGDYMGTLANSLPAAAPGVELPKFGKVKGDKAFVGIGIVAKKQTARFDVFIPTGAVKLVMQAMAEGEKKKKD